jgi:hypothetical protein
MKHTKKLTKKMLNNGKFFILFLTIVSCSTTEIYFDKDNQSIVRCNNNKIHNIIIEEVLSNGELEQIEDYFLNKSNTRPCSVKIKEIYKIFEYKDSIIFKPNTKYIITHRGVNFILMCWEL